MQTFAYEARTDDGDLTAGVISASSLEAAGVMLAEQNLFVIRVAADRDTRHRTRVRGHATRAQVTWQLSQLAIMLQTGLRLSDGLDCLERQANEPRLKRLLSEISNAVHEGGSFSDALEMYPRSFRPSTVALIQAAEASGTMSTALKRCAEHLMSEHQLRKKVQAAFSYPIFMFLMCIAVIVFLVTFILPKFADVFGKREAVLPAPTRVLLQASEHMTTHWVFWIGGVIASIVTLFFVARSRFGKKQIDALLLTVPGLSTAFHALFQGRSFRTLSVLLESGVPLLDTMQIMQRAVPNAHYRSLWSSVDQEIQRGERIAGPLLECEFIPESYAQMIDNADKSGRLSQVFVQLAEYAETEYDQTVRTLMQFIEPAMILIMGSIVGLVAAALLLPLFQAGQLMTG